MGLTAYGHNRKGDCSDIETLVIPAAGTKTAISKAVNAIKPKGKTPLSAAVINAVEALKYTENKATVILISDGKETCDFDPCEVGKRLEQSGVDFTAHVVGFDVANPADRAQLQCLAENTGGQFLTASNANELTNALEKVSTPTPPQPIQITFRAVEVDTNRPIDTNLVWTLTNTETGDYEIRYIMSQGSTILSSRPITISDAKASLIAPGVAIAGEDIIVEWVGPDYKNDYIDLANPTPVATAQTKWINYTYTKSGSPLRLQMPSEPGDYIIRYVVSQGSTIIAKHPIRVNPVGVSISAATTANAGEELLVEWDGPDYKGDYISVAKHDVSGSKYAYYTYTRQGSPLRLKMPLDAGEYELRYILSQDSSIKARQNITVKPVSVTLDFEDTAKIAEPFLINWQGPNYKNDYITVAEIGTRPSKYINYTYTQSGSPLRVTMPTKHGEYEIRYIANGSPDKVLAKKPLTVQTVTANVNLSGTATAGASALIEWTGPNYKGDYIGISKPDTQKYLSYTYTRDGSPLRLQMPDKPGTYELRYFLNAGNTIIARERITVE